MELKDKLKALGGGEEGDRCGWSGKRGRERRRGDECFDSAGLYPKRCCAGELSLTVVASRGADSAYLKGYGWE